MNVTGQRIKKVHFRKYHGLGNDYLVIDPNIHDVVLTPDTIRLICDRNFGIGADGILYGPIKSGANLIKINMGKMTFRSTKIPVTGREREVVNEELQINEVKYKVTCLSIGNPHCVIPMEEGTEQKAKELGPKVENHKMFPNRINVQLLKVIDRSNIEIRIWERGAG